MNISETLKLIEAGFTHDEIMELTKSNDAEKIEHPQTKVSSEEEKQTEVQIEEKPKEEPEVKEVKQESETEKLVKALGLKFDTLTAAIQKSNVNNIEGGESNTLTTDDIIKSFMNEGR